MTPAKRLWPTISATLSVPLWVTLGLPFYAGAGPEGWPSGRPPGPGGGWTLRDRQRRCSSSAKRRKTVDGDSIATWDLRIQTAESGSPVIRRSSLNPASLFVSLGADQGACALW